MELSSTQGASQLKNQRNLLRYILEDFKKKGGTIKVPAGYTGFEDWILDAIDTTELLKHVTTEYEMDLTELCPSKGGQSLHVLANSSSATDNGTGQLSIRGGLASESAEGQLSLPLLDTGLLEHQLKELSYTIFLACCQLNAGPTLTQVLRAQLEINEARGAEVQRLLGLLAAGSGVSAAASASLEMHVQLLQLARPNHFDSFRNYLRWRDTTCSVVVQTLSRAAQGLEPSKNGTRPESGTKVSNAIARLKGQLRRLDVRAQDEFEEEEYADAVRTFAEAAKSLAQMSASGWEFPWGLRIRLCELMLRGLFDTLEEGSYIEEKDGLLRLLQQHVWPKLGIAPRVHSSIYAWIHFRQFAVTGAPDLLGATQGLIQGMLQTPRSLQGKKAGVSPEQDSMQIDDVVLRGIVDWTRARLSDYHQNFQDPELMLGLVRVMVDAEQSSSDAPGAGAGVLCDCIRASVQAAFARLSQASSAGALNEAARLAGLARQAGQQLAAEHEVFTPVLAELLGGEAARVAAVQLHNCYGLQLMPWLGQVKRLDEHTLAAIRGAEVLELELLAEMGGPPAAPPVVPWHTMARLNPLLQGWVDSQLVQMSEWSARILQTEDWKPFNSAGSSRSSVETMKIAVEAIDALFNMKLPMPVALMKQMLQGVDAIIERYASAVAQQTGDPEALVPPAPPMTRYKRSVAVKAEATDVRDSPTRRAGSHGGGHTRGVSSDSAASTPTLAGLAGGPRTPTLAAAAEEQRLLELTLESLVVRLNSLQYVSEALAGLERSVQERWQEAQADTPSSATAAARDMDGLWLVGIFDTCSRAVTAARDGVCSFIGMKVVWYHMRQEFLEDLYRHRVDSARLAQVALPGLDSHLGVCCSAAFESLHGHIACCLLKAVVLALRRVLLDGGPSRLFIPDDTELLEADLEALSALFHAEGEGLLREAIARATAPVSELLTVMQLPTGILISNYEQAMASARPLASADGAAMLAFHPDVLVRVLSHRADRIASKFLKKELKLPKKIGSSLPFSIPSAPTFNTGISSRFSRLKAKMRV